MKKVDSDVLGVVNRALGLSGVGAPLTEFTDGTLEQVISVNDLARRGRTQAGTSGLYYGVMENDHTDAETLISQFQPYTAATGAIAPYPSPMPAGFDVWIIGAAVDQVSGTGTLEAALFIDPPAANQGWGIDDSGAAVIAADGFAIARWNGLATATREFGLQADGLPWARIGMRMMRPPLSNAVLQFSSVSSATSVFRCYITIGVFPVGLGQDIQV